MNDVGLFRLIFMDSALSCCLLVFLCLLALGSLAEIRQLLKLSAVWSVFWQRVQSYYDFCVVLLLFVSHFGTSALAENVFGII